MWPKCASRSPPSVPVEPTEPSAWPLGVYLLQREDRSFIFQNQRQMETEGEERGAEERGPVVKFQQS